MSAYLVFALGSVFLLPMVIGVFALREINRCREPMRGRWFAIASIILGQAGIMVAVIVFAVSSLNPAQTTDAAGRKPLPVVVARPAPSFSPKHTEIFKKTINANLALAKAATESGDYDSALTYLELVRQCPLLLVPQEKAAIEPEITAIEKLITQEKQRRERANYKPVRGSVGEQDPFAE
jgi:hypothetical protein